jgi:hypothetical protein
MTPKKLPSSGLKRGASLPPAFQKGRDHTEAIRVLVDVFGDPRKMMLKDVNVPEKPSGQDADSKTPRNPKVFPVGRMLGNVGIQETGSTPDGPMDLDLLDLEAQAMAAAGCPINLLPPRIHHSSMDGGDPFPAGRKV